MMWSDANDYKAGDYFLVDFTEPESGLRTHLLAQVVKIVDKTLLFFEKDPRLLEAKVVMMFDGHDAWIDEKSVLFPSKEVLEKFAKKIPKSLAEALFVKN